MNENQPVRLHVIIEGYVQGVGFRAFVLDQAVRLGVVGWVRNRWDGVVEVMAEGQHEELEKFLTLLYHGPRGAHVSGVSPEWLAATGEFKGFNVRMTGG